jgi:hypothetical protein
MARALAPKTQGRRTGCPRASYVWQFLRDAGEGQRPYTRRALHYENRLINTGRCAEQSSRGPTGCKTTPSYVDNVSASLHPQGLWAGGFATRQSVQRHPQRKATTALESTTSLTARHIRIFCVLDGKTLRLPMRCSRTSTTIRDLPKRLHILSETNRSTRHYDKLQHTWQRSRRMSIPQLF